MSAFDFNHVKRCREADTMHFHSYALNATSDGHRIGLNDRLSTDSSGIAKCLALKAEAKIDLERIVSAIEARICAETLLEVL